MELTEYIKKVKKARALINKPYGWMKGSYWNDNETSFCADGACIKVGIYDVIPYYVLNVQNFRTFSMRTTGRPPFLFNDAPKTTKKMVVKLFDDYIAYLEGELKNETA